MRARGGRENCSATGGLLLRMRPPDSPRAVGLYHVLPIAERSRVRQVDSVLAVKKRFCRTTFVLAVVIWCRKRAPKSRPPPLHQQSSRASRRRDRTTVAVSVARPLHRRGYRNSHSRSGTLVDPAARGPTKDLRQRLLSFSASICCRPDGQSVTRSSRRPLLHARKSHLADHEVASDAPRPA